MLQPRDVKIQFFSPFISPLYFLEISNILKEHIYVMKLGRIFLKFKVGQEGLLLIWLIKYNDGT